MTEAIIGRLGLKLAIPLPEDKSVDFAEGERVEIVSQGAELVIRKMPRN